MPIVGNGEDIYVNYQIPENIKKIITYEFLKEFRNQLIRIHHYWSIDTFAEEGIPMNTSTNGWHTAFGKACILTNNKKLYNYWRSLDWYDSDIFDGELSEILIENNLILGDLSKIIEEKLGIKESDLRSCCDCCKLYTSDMVVELFETEEKNEISGYRCFGCNDIKNTIDGNVNATDYYRSCIKEIKNYEW